MRKQYYTGETKKLMGWDTDTKLLLFSKRSPKFPPCAEAENFDLLHGDECLTLAFAASLGRRRCHLTPARIFIHAVAPVEDARCNQPSVGADLAL